MDIQQVLEFVNEWINAWDLDFEDIFLLVEPKKWTYSYKSKLRLYLEIS
jgi:hypothetical protein